MKITIEWKCSYEATLTISGRKLKVKMRPGMTSLEGIKEPETSSTFGGIIASGLFSKVGDIMQAHAIAEDELCPDGCRDITWEEMDASLAEEVSSRMF